MTRTSLLTSGLDGLTAKSPAIAQLLADLLALDDVLQDAHRAAKEDEENGERVVAAYEAFLRHREQLIAQLKTEGVAVPWQLRMRIDDIELTLRQRKEKREANDKETSSVKEATANAAKAEVAASAAAEDAKEEDPLLLLKAMILPSVLMGLIACVVYGAASFSA